MTIIYARRAAEWFAVVAVSTIALVGSAQSRAHCDTLDGPVVDAARNALDTGNVDRALIWVRAEDEAEIMRAFEKTLAVRKLDAAARDLADTYFYETLVRVHRAGEGAAFTGLAPAGTDLGPAIPSADAALETGSIDAVAKLLTERVRDGLERQFQTAMAKRNFKPDDVAAGRRYVAAYVEYIHYVERVFEAASTPAHGHYPDAESSRAHAIP